MARYRPEMKKYYYDPSKSKTYLDQLGIKYPTTGESSTVNDQSPTPNSQSSFFGNWELEVGSWKVGS